MIEELQIELAGICNADCSYCTWRKRTVGKQLMDVGLALKLVGEAVDMGVRLITFHGVGESTLHPQLITILRHAESVGLTTRLSTNCYTLRGDLSDNLKSLKSLQMVLAVPYTMAKKKPDFVDTCLRNAQAYAESFENRSVYALIVCAQGAEFHVDRHVKAFDHITDPRFRIHLSQPKTWPNDTPNKGFIRKDLIAHNRIVELNDTPRSLAADCNMPNNFLMVLADGTCVPCCVGMDEWGLGRVQGCSIKEVWDSEAMAVIRDKWHKADASIPCGNCKNRTDCITK